MARLEAEEERLKEEGAQLSLAQDIEAARASAVAEYKESYDFRVEQVQIV